MKITIASLSNKGSRSINQDSLGHIIGERSACFIVCDGIAGQPGGEVASKAATSSILENFYGDRHLDSRKIRQYIIGANKAIRKKQQSTEFTKMGATIISLFIDRDYELAYWAHVGDSRLYLFRHGCLHTVTRDHSLVEQMKSAGYQTAGVNSSLLYHALGQNYDKEAAYGDVLQLENGDAFLLCTDGLWHTIETEQMEQMLHMVNSPEEWLALMQKAWSLKNNGDNCSAIAVWVGEPQEATLLYSLSNVEHFLPIEK